MRQQTWDEVFGKKDFTMEEDAIVLSQMKWSYESFLDSTPISTSKSPLSDIDFEIESLNKRFEALQSS